MRTPPPPTSPLASRRIIARCACYLRPSPALRASMRGRSPPHEPPAAAPLVPPCSPPLLAAPSLAPVRAEAQYFGQNKVQYRDFDFKVLKTEHFDIYYYPEEEAAVEQAGAPGRALVRAASRGCSTTASRAASRSSSTPAIPHFEQTNVLQGSIGEGTGGVTEVLKRRVVMPFAGPLAETDHVLGHELVHAFQFDMTGGGGATSSSNIPNAVRLPLWFIEGMAEYLSVGPVDPHTAMWMRDAARREKLPTIRQLSDPELLPVPLRAGALVLHRRALGRRGGGGRAARRRPASPTRRGSWSRSPGSTTRSCRSSGTQAVRDAYRAGLRDASATPPTTAGLVISEKNAGELNVAPALSPDGSAGRLPLGEGPLLDRPVRGRRRHRQGAAQARSRPRPIRTSTACSSSTPPATGTPAGGASCSAASARASRSSSSSIPRPGAASARSRSRRWARSPIPPGRPTGSRSRSPPSWAASPTSSSTTSGASALRRLTNDAFADLQPAWSPDGRTIAFVTDRFSSRLEALTVGNYRLAAIDAASRRHPPAARASRRARTSTPSGPRTARSLFFISDRNGISNVYRLDVASGEHVAGHRPRHRRQRDHRPQPVALRGPRPRWSSAPTRRTSTASTPSRTRRGWPADPLDETADRLRAATLPPRERSSDEVLAFRGDPTYGLPASRGFETADYKPEALPRLHRPADPHRRRATARAPSWAAACRSCSATSSATTPSGPSLQVNGQLADFGGVVGYENRKHRWTWGARPGADPVRHRQLRPVAGTDRQRAGRRRGGGALPPDQPVGLGLRRLSLQPRPARRAERRPCATSASARSADAGLLERHRRAPRSTSEEDLPAPDGLTYGEVGAALVYDTSIFGATSPILGQRYRLEVTPTFGLAPVHGRAGRLPPLLHARAPVHLRLPRPALRPLRQRRRGQPRSRRSSSATRTSCAATTSAPSTPASAAPIPTARARCSTSSSGSKILVGNAELRFPPFGPISGSRRNLYGPLPARARLLRRHRRGLDGGRRSRRS